jgi:hypothetical protein
MHFFAESTTCHALEDTNEQFRPDLTGPGNGASEGFESSKMFGLKLSDTVIGVAFHSIIKGNIISLKFLIIVFLNIDGFEELMHPFGEGLIEMGFIFVVGGEDFEGHFGVEVEEVRVGDG